MGTALALAACGGGDGANHAGAPFTPGDDAGAAGVVAAGGTGNGSAGSGGGKNLGAAGEAGASAGGEGGASGALGEGGEAGAAPTASSIAIQASSTTIATTIGTASTPLLLHAVTSFSDSSTAPTAMPVWTSDDPNIATVTQDGILVATGAYAGKVTIRVSGGGADGSLTFDVQLSSTIYEGTLTSGDHPALSAGDAATGGPAWQYPEAGTVFPARMTPPLFQWVKGSDAAFHLSFARGTDVTVDVYTSNADYQPSAAVWAALGSGYGTAVSVSLEAKATLSASTPRRASDARSFTTADAALSGAMYLFNAAGATAFSRLSLPSGTGPTSLFPADGVCRSCHATSRDGSLVAFQYDGPETLPSGVLRTSDSATLIARATQSQWSISTFSPNGLRLVGEELGVLGLFDMSNPSAPASLPLGISTTNATQPMWSPDGSTLAFVQYAAVAGANDYTFTKSSVYTSQWDAKNGVFQAPALLTAGEAATNRASLSFPSWSPDSRYLALGVGSNNYVPTAMTIELEDVKQKTRVALGHAMPSGINETPAFAPRAQGGFYFLAFTSNRTYGHKSTEPQIWVTAIDGNIQNGVDPSHPAFWLPNQDTSGINVLPEWAPDACAGRGTACTIDGDCCGGLSCLASGSSKQCGANACAVMGEACKTASDCCAGATLTCGPDLAGNSVCQPPAP